MNDVILQPLPLIVIFSSFHTMTPRYWKGVTLNKNGLSFQFLSISFTSIEISNLPSPRCFTSKIMVISPSWEYSNSCHFSGDPHPLKNNWDPRVPWSYTVTPGSTPGFHCVGWPQWSSSSGSHFWGQDQIWWQIYGNFELFWNLITSALFGLVNLMTPVKSP